MPIRKRLKTDDEGFTEEARKAAEGEIVERSKRIDFYLVEYTIEFLANKMKEGEFVVPAYQREFTWEERRRSRFIESILMGLPIPFLFFWEMEDGRLDPPSFQWTPMLAFRSWRGVSDECSTPGVSGIVQAGGR